MRAATPHDDLDRGSPMTRTVCLAGVLIALLAAPTVAQTPAWSTPTKPFKVIDNTYYVGTQGIASYLIATPEGDILIDVGLPQNAALVEANIKSLGRRLTDVKFILVSHGHFDHAGGLAKLKADTGAVVVAGIGERYALQKGVYVGSESDKQLDFPPVTLDGEIADGQVISLGGAHLTAHLTPGHTKGCTTWTWPVKDADGSAHTAIYFCSGSVAANRLVPEQYPGIVADYRATFPKARALQGDVFLAPHTEFFEMEAKRAKLAKPGPNPFIDRAGYLKLLNDQQAAFESALAAAQAKAKNQAMP